jgi:hypothetical protein
VRRRAVGVDHVTICKTEKDLRVRQWLQEQQRREAHKLSLHHIQMKAALISFLPPCPRTCSSASAPHLSFVSPFPVRVFVSPPSSLRVKKGRTASSQYSSTCRFSFQTSPLPVKLGTNFSDKRSVQFARGLGPLTLVRLQ